MMQLAIEFDARRLAKRDGPQTSKEAAARAVNFRASPEASIFAAICDSDARGATMHEIAVVTGLEPVQVGRRLGAMGARRVIERRALTDCSGFEARGGCCVWRRT